VVPSSSVTIDGHFPTTLFNDESRWVQYRARPHTELIRQVRRIAREKQPAALSVQQSWGYGGARHPIDGNLRGMLLDVATWAREGLVD